MNFSYQSRLKADLARWQSDGLLEQATTSAILDDLESRKSSYSFSSIVALLGVVCLCFAVITFVASNWDALSRLGRVILLFAALWASYGLSVLAKFRGAERWSQVLILLSCAIFGASIMLISQIYHMQGEPRDAVFLWALGTIIAAVVLRSVPALVLAALLFILWDTMAIFDFSSRNPATVNYLFLPILLVLAAAAWWMQSRLTAHFVAIGGLIWLTVSSGILSEQNEDLVYVSCVYFLVFLGIAVLLQLREKRHVLNGFDEPLIWYLLVMIGTGVVFWMFATESRFFFGSAGIISQTIWPIWLLTLIGVLIAGDAFRVGSNQAYDLGFLALWMVLSALLYTFRGVSLFPFVVEALGLAMSVWSIRMGARQELPNVTRLGYLGFASIMLIVYFSAAGHLLDTTAFYFITGILMVAAAIFLPKWFRAKPVERSPEGGVS